MTKFLFFNRKSYPSMGSYTIDRNKFGDTIFDWSRTESDIPDTFINGIAISGEEIKNSEHIIENLKEHFRLSHSGSGAEVFDYIMSNAHLNGYRDKVFQEMQERMVQPKDGSPMIILNAANTSYHYATVSPECVTYVEYAAVVACTSNKQGERVELGTVATLESIHTIEHRDGKPKHTIDRINFTHIDHDICKKIFPRKLSLIEQIKHFVNQKLEALINLFRCEQPRHRM